MTPTCPHKRLEFHFRSNGDARPPKRKDQRQPRSPTPPPMTSLSSSTSTLTSSQGQDSSLADDYLNCFKGKPVQIKNAVMMLNEMFPPPRAPQYKVTSQTGPPNNPTFSMVSICTFKCLNSTNVRHFGISTLCIV